MLSNLFYPFSRDTGATIFLISECGFQIIKDGVMHYWITGYGLHGKI